MIADQCVALLPYFTVRSGELGAFKALCNRFVEKTQSEPGCLYYAFTFDGNLAHCREGYVDTAALLAHLQNVGAILEEALKIAEIYRREVHGPTKELDQLRESLAGLNPQYFVLDHGFRR